MKHYRHRLVIQAVTQTRSEFGEPVEAWATASTVWGLVLPGGGGETQTAGKTASTGAHTIELWYLSTLTTKHRISFGGDIFAIASIENVDGCNRVMRLTCTVTE